MKRKKQDTFKNATFILVKSVLVILLILLVQCKKSPTDIDDNKNNTPRTSVPAVLVAEWQSGTVSSVNFYNPNTGAWGAPSGTGMFFKFSKDGYYEKGVLLQSSLYGHTTTFFAYNKGTMTVEDDVIVLYPTYGIIKSVDNWITENNYEKPDELNTEAMVWELGVDDYGFETLWLSYPDSGPSAFHRT